MYTHHQNHVWGLFSVPRSEWKAIREEKANIGQFASARLAILAAIPAVSFLIGITTLGWSLSGAEFHQLTFYKAIPMTIAFYLLIGVATLLMAYFTFTMERAFGTEAGFERCMLFVTYTATPMYIAGLIGFVPIVWLCMAVLLASILYSLYLLYVGIPIYMNIPEGKGFVVSTAIISAGLCILVVFNITAVVIWNMVVI